MPESDVDFEVLELASLRSVHEFCSRFRASHDHVDVVIANAGVMAAPFGRTEDGFELHFGTNHLGHFVLIGRLLPLLLTGRPVRVVVLSSGGHAASDIRWEDPNFEQGGYTKMEAYGQSKTANILHAVELQRRYGARGLQAYSVHPGMVATDLGRHFTREDYQDLKARAQASTGGGLPPRVRVEVGAATSVWAAVADSLETHGGAYLADCAVAEARPYATTRCCTPVVGVVREVDLRTLPGKPDVLAGGAGGPRCQPSERSVTPPHPPLAFGTSLIKRPEPGGAAGLACPVRPSS